MTEAAAASQLIETYRGAVYPWHCDHMAHMNVMWYVGKFDEATWNLFAHVGLTPTMLRGADRGMAAVDQRIAYQNELHAGDIVAVSSAVIAVGKTSLKFVHDMRNAETGAAAAVTLLTAVHLDLKVRKPTALPSAIADRARALIVDYKLPW